MKKPSIEQLEDIDLGKTIKGTHRFPKGESEPIPARSFPGPWEYDGNQEITTSPKRGSWRLICTIPAMAGNTDFANARLIAAAPDMLEVVKAILEAYGKGVANGGSIDWGDIDHAYELAVDALVKIKGDA